METNVEEFIGELNAGIFREKLAHVLSECALGTVTHGNGKKKGKVTIELTLNQVGENNQVIVSQKLASITPTKRGKKSEEDTTETPMHVGRGGAMTATPPKEENSGQFTLEKQSEASHLKAAK